MRKFLMHLAFGPYAPVWGETNPTLVITHRDIAAMTCQDIEDKNWRSGDFLDKAKKVFPGLIINDYKIMELSRSIEPYTFPQDLQDAIDKERSKRQTDTVDFLTGEIYHDARYAKMRKQDKELIKKVGYAPTPEQTFVIDYLNNRDERIFNYAVKKNYVAASDLLYSEFVDHPYRSRYVRMLGDLRQDAKPLYYASANSYRLFSRRSIAHLPRSVRKTLVNGWVDFDISSAYLAILTKMLGLKLCNEVLTTGLWNYCRSQGIQKSEEIKKHLYALCFGSRMHNRRAKNQDPASLPFLDLPFVQELHDACKKEIKNISQSLNVSNEDARTELTKRVSKIEFELLYPAFKLASESNSFQIALYQYDGFSISCEPDKRAAAINKITKTLDTHFAGLGYNTSITHEVL